MKKMSLRGWQMPAWLAGVTDSDRAFGVLDIGDLSGSTASRTRGGGGCDFPVMVYCIDTPDSAYLQEKKH